MGRSTYFWRRTGVLGAILVLSGLPLAALNPERSITQYNSRTWRRDNGLPTNSVNAIAIGNDGRVWLGAARGMILFDGVEFQLVTKAGAEGFEGKVITTLVPRRTGGYWYGLDNGGYGFFDGKIAKPLPLPEWTRNELSIRSVNETREGRLLFASTSSAGISTPEGTMAPLFPENWVDVFSTYEDPDGTIWIGTAELGLFTWKDGKLQPFHDTSLKGEIIHTIARDPKGNLWLATPNGLRGYDSQLRRLPGPRTDALRTLMVDSHGTLWMGTVGNGLLRYQDGKLMRFTRPQGLASDDVYAIAESKDGSLWIGTSDGLTQLSDLKFPIISRPEGLVSDGALCVAASMDGGLWVGTPNGVSYLKDGVFTSYGANGSDGLGSVWVKRIFPARDGKVYFIGARKNIDQFAGASVVRSWNFAEWPRDISEDSKGLLVAVARKLKRIENGEPVPYRLRDGSEAEPGWINALLTTEDDTVYLATEDGLFQIKDGEMVDLCQKNGLPKTRYYFLGRDKEGNVWAAQNRGIARCRDGKMEIATREHGLHEHYVYALIADSIGNFWMDSARGIFRVSQDDLNAVLDGKLDQVRCTVFEGADTVKSSDKVALEYSGTRTPDGKIWFPTTKGVVMIDPLNIPGNPPPPPVSIVHIRVNGKPFQTDQPNTIDPGPGNLEFDYAALEYITPQKVQYRYRLDGLDKEWVMAGSRRSAFYTNLPPGRYRFDVQASNSDSGWNEVVASVTLDLPRRFYETFAFRSLSAGFLLGIAWYVVWARNMHRRKSELEQANTVMEEKVRERTAELRAEIEERKRAQEETERLHDELRASVVAAQAAAKAKSRFLANMSHEIRTPMNAVIGMSNLLLETPLDPHQRELAETTRNSADALLRVLNDILDFSKMEAGKLGLEDLDFNLRDIVEESVELISVHAAEKHLEMGSLLARDLPSRVRGDASRLRQVLLNLLGNAVKFTSSGQVVVTARLDDIAAEGGTRVRFEIRDTGIGIDPATQAELFQPFTQADTSTTRRFGGTGLGLAISQQIVTLMHGTIGVTSQPGHGSTFWFSIPFAPAKDPGSPAAPAAAGLDGLRLLLLHPSSTVRDVVQYYATPWGVHVVPAETLESAQHLVSEAQVPFDAVITAPLATSPGTDHLSAPVLMAKGKTLPAILVTAMPLARMGPVSSASHVIALVPMPIRLQKLLHALQVAAGATQPVTAGRHEIASPTVPPAHLRILVAEDNVVNQRVVQLQLKKAGYSAKIVANGLDVLKAVEESVYDVIIMDCQMPELDGYETTRRLRQDERTRDIYVIAMTANSLEGDRERCLAAGMNDYLAKPTREKDLVAALQRAPTRQSAQPFFRGRSGPA